MKVHPGFMGNINDYPDRGQLNPALEDFCDRSMVDEEVRQMTLKERIQAGVNSGYGPDNNF